VAIDRAVPGQVLRQALRPVHPQGLLAARRVVVQVPKFVSRQTGI
jgi:DNA-binding transcriptional regulator YdaS (Cro superfamily)